MQYGIKSRPYLVILYTLELKRGKSALMSSEKWKPCGRGVVTCNAADE